MDFDCLLREALSRLAHTNASLHLQIGCEALGVLVLVLDLLHIQLDWVHVLVLLFQCAMHLNVHTEANRDELSEVDRLEAYPPFGVWPDIKLAAGLPEVSLYGVRLKKVR